MRLHVIAVMIILVLVSATACSRRQEAPASKQVRVSATKDFERYFGPAPITDKGNCYAFVIYFPSSKQPGKVVPFPFFSFDEASLEKVAVQRLLAGMDDVKSYRGELSQPFAPETRLLSLDERDGSVSVNFDKNILQGEPDAANERAGVAALLLTVAQFHGVKEVRILVDGKEGELNKVSLPGQDAVVQLPPPRLLGVTAMRDQGASAVEEVNAFFDRPVEIKALTLAGADGKPFRGDIYQSVFDMAGVLKPKDPALFKAGMPITVRWDVTDKLGRHAAGVAVLPLEVKQH